MPVEYEKIGITYTAFSYTSGDLPPLGDHTPYFPANSIYVSGAGGTDDISYIGNSRTQQRGDISSPNLFGEKFRHPLIVWNFTNFRPAY